MKKIYSKPEIMFECFTLSTNIAGDCEVKTHSPGNSTCGLTFSDGTSVFLTGMGGCKTFEVTPENGDGMWNGICYHVPVETSNLFNS